MSPAENCNVLIIVETLEMGHDTPRRRFREAAPSIRDSLVSREPSVDLAVRGWWRVDVRGRREGTHTTFGPTHGAKWRRLEWRNL